MRKILRVLPLTAVCLAAVGTVHAQNAPPAGDAANGKRLYMETGCYQCHGTVGQGSRGTGPHLAPKPMPYAAFAGQVRKPVNAMPPYTSVVLSDQELADIYAYLLTVPPLPDPKDATILEH